MNKDLLQRITTSIAAARAHADSITTLEQDLASSKRELRTILEHDIPEAMREADVRALTLEDGTKVRVANELRIGSDGMGFATFPAEQRAAALNWLREHNLGNAIRHIVAAEFGKTEDTAAAALLQFLQQQRITHSDKESVHPQTLKALLREQLEKGVDVPYETFGLSVVNVAKIAEVKSTEKE